MSQKQADSNEEVKKPLSYLKRDEIRIKLFGDYQASVSQEKLKTEGYEPKSKILLITPR